MGILQAVAGPLSESFRSLGAVSQVAVVVAAVLGVSALINVGQQILLRNPNEPPVVFHIFPWIGSTITYGIDPPTFFRENQRKVCHTRWL